MLTTNLIEIFSLKPKKKKKEKAKNQVLSVTIGKIIFLLFKKNSLMVPLGKGLQRLNIQQNHSDRFRHIQV